MISIFTHFYELLYHQYHLKASLEHIEIFLVSFSIFLLIFIIFDLIMINYEKRQTIYTLCITNEHIRFNFRWIQSCYRHLKNYSIFMIAYLMKKNWFTHHGRPPWTPDTLALCDTSNCAVSYPGGVQFAYGFSQ